MKKYSLLTLGLGLILCLNGCSNRRTFVDTAFGTGEQQYQMMLDRVDISEGFPRTVDGHGNVKTTDVWDWTGGFFPGGLWYLYEYTQNPAWKAAAEKWTEALEERSEEHTSELQSRENLVCRLLLEKKKKT